MIILFENGRLGNQLFQYIGIKKLYKEHKIILIGFESLMHACNYIDAYIISKKIFKYQLFLKATQFFFGILAIIRLISSANELCNDANEYGIKLKKGLFCNIILVIDSYFQDKIFFNDIPKHLDIKKEIRESGIYKLQKLCKGATNRAKVFVHIRRGDYVAWPDRAKPAVLPYSWYAKAIIRIREVLDDPLFIICTDDIPYAEDFFKEDENFIIMQTDESSDLAIMSQCDHGILSSSSFSWWAAYFSSRKSIDSDKRFLFIAPIYWLGHRERKWHPSGIRTDWIEYQ
jgi:hypothetical protein